MSVARIVTDSSADLAPEVASELGISVVPLNLRVGGEEMADVPSLRSPEFYKRTIKGRSMPTVLASEPRPFAAAYAELAQETDDIVSIHISASLHNAVQAANQGRGEYLGRCQIRVFDSQLISRALGVLVVEAARAARAGTPGSEIVRLLRGLVPHIYFAFYVDNSDYLRRNGLLRTPRDSAIGHPNVKPLLIMEEGKIAPVQRQRNRGKPTERLLEFMAEFPKLQQLALLSSGLGSDLAEFRTELAALFPHQVVEEHVYGPVLLSFVGPAALGVVAFESC